MRQGKRREGERLYTEDKEMEMGDSEKRKREAREKRNEGQLGREEREGYSMPAGYDKPMMPVSSSLFLWSPSHNMSYMWSCIHLFGSQVLVPFGF